MVKLAKVFLVAAALQCRFGGSESKEEGEAADCSKVFLVFLCWEWEDTITLIFRLRSAPARFR